MSPSSSSSKISVRKATLADSDAIAQVCLLTANKGQSAAHLLHHPDLPAHVGPLSYLHVRSGFGFVLVKARSRRQGSSKERSLEKVVGYVVGTADAALFTREADARWWPIMRMRYPQNTIGTPLDRYFVGQIYRPSHPVRMHIAVLDKYQKSGCDRILVEIAVRHLRSHRPLASWPSDKSRLLSDGDSDVSLKTIDLCLV